MSAQEGETLGQATLRGDIGKVKSLVLARTQLSAVLGDNKAESQEDLNFALSYAASNGHSAIVSFLLDHGAQIRAGTILSATEDLTNARAIFEIFIRHGWDINAGAITPSMFSPRFNGPRYPILRYMSSSPASL